MERVYGPEIVELFRLVKDCFDPLGILNPGVILPAVPDEAPLSRLKVGADAAPIPEDIAAGTEADREGGRVLDAAARTWLEQRQRSNDER